MDYSFFKPKPWLSLFQTDFSSLSQHDARRRLAADCSQPPAKEQWREQGHEKEQEEAQEDARPTVHLLSLPSEVISYILSLLDAEQLSTLAQVSTHFLRHVYDPRHWRRIALANWPKETPVQLERRLLQYKNWRRLCIHRPRLRTNAVYVVRHQFAKTSSRAATEEPVAPVFLVKYYRFLRFYNDGTVVSLTTAEMPHLALRRVRRGWRPGTHERDKTGPAIGRYSLNESTLDVEVELPMRNSKFPQMRTGTMFMHMELCTTKDGAWDRLRLTDHYAIMDQDGGDLVPYRAETLRGKPFRLVPIWGFKTAVYREFPLEDERDLAQWFEMKKAARAARSKELAGGVALR